MSALKGNLFFNTGPFKSSPPPNNTHHELSWTNPESVAIQIKSLTVTMGVSMGGKCDFQVIVGTGNSTWLTLIGWDRYAEPTGSISKTISFGNDWVEVPASGKLLLSTFCTGFSTPLPDAHVLVNGLYALST